MPAPVGNQYTRKYTLEEALPLFEKAREYARINDDCLCVQDAVKEANIPSRTFYDLCDQFDVLQDIKRDINDFVISRVNRGALKGDYNATAGIWRMKQLGEKDKHEVEQTNIDQISIYRSLPKKEREARILELAAKFKKNA